MALDQNIVFNVNVSAGQAAAELDALTNSTEELGQAVDDLATSNKTLKQQLKEATNEAQLLADKFGANSKEATDAARKVAHLKEEISDFKDRVDALNPEAKFKAFGQALSGVAGGFAAAEGAMALFGGESEELQKHLLKVQAALALSQGINELRGLGDAIGNVKLVALDMFKSIKAAIVSNPLLAIATAVIAITSAVAAWIMSEGDVAEEIKKSKDAETKRLEASQKSYDRQIERAKLLGKETAALERQKQMDALQSAKTQLELDKRLEKSNLELAKSRLYVMSLTNSTFKDAYDQAVFALDNFDKYSKKKFADQIATIGDLEQGLSNQRLKTILDANTAVLKNSDEAFKKQQELNEKAKAENEKKKAEDEKNREIWKKNEQEETEFEAEELKKREAESAAFDEKEKQRLADEAAAEQATLDAKIAIWEKEQDEKEKQQKLDEERAERNKNFAVDSLLQTTAIITDLNSAFGKKSEANAKRAFQIQKQVATAQALIETYKSAQGAYASQLVAGDPTSPIRAAIAAGFAIAQGLARVAKIRSQQFDGGGSSGGGGGASVPSVPNGQQAPTINPDQTQSTILDRNRIEAGGQTPSNQTPVKVFVTESDISQTINKVDSIKQKATIQ